MKFYTPPPLCLHLVFQSYLCLSNGSFLGLQPKFTEFSHIIVIRSYSKIKFTQALCAPFIVGRESCGPPAEWYVW